MQQLKVELPLKSETKNYKIFGYEDKDAQKNLPVAFPIYVPKALLNGNGIKQVTVILNFE